MHAPDELLTLSSLARLLGCAHNPHEVVWRAEVARPRFDVTALASALRERSDLLGVEWSKACVDRARQRDDDYDCVLAPLATGFRYLKGPAIGGLYPAWSHRQANDRDIAVVDADTAVGLVSALASRTAGRVEAVTRVVRGSTVDLAVRLEWPARDEIFDRPMRVEVFTDPLISSPDRSPQLLQGDSPGFQLVCLLAEVWDRRLGIRDLIDIAFLLAQDDDMAEAFAACRLHGLDGPFRDAIGALASIDYAPATRLLSEVDRAVCGDRVAGTGPGVVQHGTADLAVDGFEAADAVTVAGITFLFPPLPDR